MKKLLFNIIPLFLISPFAFGEIAYLNPLDAQQNLKVTSPTLKLSGITVTPAIKLTTLMVSGGTFPDGSVSVNDSIRSSVGASNGRYYWEIRVLASKPENTYNAIGFADANEPLETPPGSYSGCAYFRGGQVQCSDGQFQSTDTYTTGDVIGFALDLTLGKLYISKNKIWQIGNPSNATGGLNVSLGVKYFPMLTLSEGDSFLADFGQIQATRNAPNGYGILK